MAISVLFTKSQNTNIHTFKDNMRSQLLLQIKIYITLSIRWHIQVPVTGRQTHLSLEITIILCRSWLQSCFAAQLVWGVVHFSGKVGDATVKMLVGVGFPVVLPSFFPSFFRGV